MPFSQHTFDSAVWDAVSRIKAGEVRSYGEVARAAGYPGHARMVGKAMKRSTAPLPWHRVVRADRTLAFAIGSQLYNDQRALLEQEGVRIINGKVVLPEPGDEADLDRLLWGPPDYYERQT